MQKRLRQGLFWFILLQPFLNFYWLNTPPLSEILPFSIPTIVRIVAIFVLFCMYFSQKRNWQILKKQWWIILYLVLLVIYSTLHLLHVRNFNSVSPTDYNFSMNSEIFYLVRMFLPLVVLYITKYINFSQKTMIRITQSLVGIFSGIIVLSNLFIKSLRSYGDGWIGYNIIDWFTHQPLSYTLTASKGLFYFANTLSAIMFMLVAMMIYITIKHFNWLNVALLILQGLAMIMIGTKTSTLGFLIMIAIWLVAYFIHAFVLKNAQFSFKIAAVLIVIGGLYGLMLPKSPMVQRANADLAWAKINKGPHSEKVLNKKLAAGLKKTKTKKERNNYLKTFFKENYKYYHINEQFITESYPYQEDAEFWYNLITDYPALTRMKNRFVEMEMLTQVTKRNHNSFDRWLGISYARTSNIYNLERDFVYQSFSLGWIGVILFLGVYVISELYAIFWWLKEKACRSMQHTALIFTNGVCLASAFYSGNVMDFLTATLILAFFTGYMLMLVDQNRATKKLA